MQCAGNIKQNIVMLSVVDLLASQFAVLCHLTMYIEVPFE